MLEWIASHRWWFFIAVEISFWVLVIGFLVMRYGFGIRSHRVFLWLLALNLLSFLALGIIDFRETGQFSTFQVVVVVALVYSVTYGPKDMKRLDRYMRLKIARWKGESLPPEEKPACWKKEKRKKRKNMGASMPGSNAGAGISICYSS